MKKRVSSPPEAFDEGVIRGPLPYHRQTASAWYCYDDTDL